MYSFFTIILVAISLSMDAFSLSLVYGTMKISNKNAIVLSLIVGIYHFIMPLFGYMFGSIITNYFIVDTTILVAIIFAVIGIQMIFSSLKDNDNKFLVSLGGFLLFGLSVSIDSLTTGIGLNILTNNYFLAAFIFAVTSSLFTYIGLKFGNKLNEKYGKYSMMSGGIILLILAVYYYF